MTTHPVVIIGSGPAGYTAGVYAARAQLNPIMFTGTRTGGQLMWTSDVENFPGFPDGVRGPQLMSAMQQQATKFGTEIRYEFVSAVDLSEYPFKIWTQLPEGWMPDAWETATPAQRKEARPAIVSQEPIALAKSIIISTGAISIMLGVPGEKEFFGKGVSTCAVCDAAFYKDKTTFVVGGGDSAMEDALALTKFAKTVTVIHRRSEFKASKIMQERVLNHPKITVLWNSTVSQVSGDEELKKILIKTDGKETEYQADGLFIAVGHKPVTSIFEGQLELDPHGYIVTRNSFSEHGLQQAQKALTKEKLVAFPSMTSVEGVFAAGDVVDVRYKQAITAAGQGCMAALDAERWLEAR